MSYQSYILITTIVLPPVVTTDLSGSLDRISVDSDNALAIIENKVHNFCSVLVVPMLI